MRKIKECFVFEKNSRLKKTISILNEEMLGDVDSRLLQFLLGNEERKQSNVMN
jgi:hypothetical protein